MRKIGGVALLVVGIIVFVWGVLSATVLKPASVLSGATKADGAGIVATAPGVLDMGGNTVDVKVASESGSEVFVGFGYSDDVAAYAEGLRTQLITGFDDDALATTMSSGEADPIKVTDSDMWFSKETGEGKAEFSYTTTATGAESLIASTADGTIPTVELRWDVKGGQNNSVVLILIGVLASLVGALMLYLQWQDDRRAGAQRRERGEELSGRRDRAGAETSILPAFSEEAPEPGTREADVYNTGQALGAGILMESPRGERIRTRPLPVEDTVAGLVGEDSPAQRISEAMATANRERDELHEKQQKATGGAYGAGVIAASPQADEIRARELSEEDRVVLPEPEPEPEARTPEERAAYDSGILPVIRPGEWSAEQPEQPEAKPEQPAEQPEAKPEQPAEQPEAKPEQPAEQPEARTRRRPSHAAGETPGGYRTDQIPRIKARRAAEPEVEIDEATSKGWWSIWGGAGNGEEEK